MVKKKEERKRGRKRHRSAERMEGIGTDDEQRISNAMASREEIATTAALKRGQDLEWMLPSQEHLESQAKDGTAPFGFVDSDLKEYIRSANTTLKTLMSGGNGEERVFASGSKEVAKLRDAALNELLGHELALATDPETSIALETLIVTMTSRQIRILADGFLGQ